MSGSLPDFPERKLGESAWQTAGRAPACDEPVDVFALVESLLHRLRRRFSRSEWAVRRLGLAVSEGTHEAPGLLLIQIDGLSRRQLEAAMAAGRMPFLRRLVERGQYPLRTFYSGLPSTTPAVQAELYYGVKAAVPAFSFLDRESGKMGMMFYPEWARRFEERFAGQAEGLLQGGSSWSNIYGGGAAPEETNFCVAGLGAGGFWRRGRFLHLCQFAVLQFPALLRIAGLVLLELIIGLPEAIRGIVQGQWFTHEIGMVLSRMCLGIGLRELVTIGGKIDVTRGLPVVHLNFLGYDELAHRRGPGSRFAHWSLRGIDKAIRDLYREAGRSQRRDYHVWIFSDHGQEQTRSFAMEYSGGIEHIVAECLGRELRTARRADPVPLWQRSVFHRHRYHLATFTEDAFSLAATGPVGHLYLHETLDDARKQNLARRLVAEGRVPGVLAKTAGKAIWYHAGGEAVVPEDCAGLLKTHPESLREEMARDLLGLCENTNSGDLILLGWGPQGPCWSFAPERGAHAGPGPEETQGFLLVPPATCLPSGPFVRPGGLRAAALHLLGRQHFLPPAAEDLPPSRIRVMSYNVHSCIGMDGRVSPRRIARVIAQQGPDLIALQELDHGRLRSRGEDQAMLIAEFLGYHVAFCPTVVRGAERYGHAVLSRWPIETVKVSGLPSHRGSWWKEARGALWSRVKIGNLAINVVTTHLGLGAAERMLQIQDLLGAGWIGPVLETEAVILCGDFNFLPGSAPYRIAAARLHDAAGAAGRALRTFSSSRPFARIDHIFVSRHFSAEHPAAIINDLTRVASDHLPIQVDLHLTELQNLTGIHAEGPADAKDMQHIGL